MKTQPCRPRSFSRRARTLPSRARQRGTMLIIALIVLVALTLAGIATMRSVDTATIVAGNIGLRQASVNAADQGIQAGVNWLTATLALAPDFAGNLINDNHAPAANSVGYFSSVAPSEPDWYSPANWSEAAQLNNGNPDAGGYVVSFLIHRMCSVPNCGTSGTCSSKSNTCASTLTTSALAQEGMDQTRPTDSHTTLPFIHYRITARAVGPRNSISVVQSMVRAF
jgi:type IV pilus assembly protein PilX